VTIDPPFLAQSFPISARADYRAIARAMSASGKNPPILYHYTDAAGLVGIVGPSSWGVEDPGKVLARAAQLRASDVRYMNDTQELLFGAAPLIERLRSAAADSPPTPQWAAALDRLATAFSNPDVFAWKLRCFAVCFCESGDLLSQWRGYAGGVGGYAIGFSWDAVAEHSFAFHPETTVNGTAPFPAWLRQVSYDTPAAEVVTDQFVGWLRRDYENGGFVRAQIEGGEIGVYLLATVVLGELAVLKHRAFEDEQEWRLLAVSEPLYPVRVRPRPLGVLPYLDIAVNMQTQDAAADLPATFAKVVVGPGPDQLGQVAATRELMKACGHDPDVVVPSTVPFRG
jgi:hypothetical protein